MWPVGGCIKQVSLYLKQIAIYTYGDIVAIVNDTGLCVYHFIQGHMSPQILNLRMESTLLFIPMSIVMAMRRALLIAPRVCTHISIVHGLVSLGYDALKVCFYCFQYT